MNWDAIGAVGEVLGALVVIATIIYLSIQVRQSKEATIASTELEATAHLSKFVERIADRPSLQRTWDALTVNAEVSQEEFSDFLWHTAAFFHIAEGIWDQYQRGLISERTWQEWERTMVGNLTPQLINAWWRRRYAPYSVEFYDFMDTALASRPDWTQPSVQSIHDAHQQRG